MTINIFLINTTTKKKRTWGTIKNNPIFELFLNFRYGQIEAETTKTLRVKDIYTMAGFASIYLMNYKEPKIDRSKNIVDNQTLLDIERMKMTKTYAAACLNISFNIISNITPNEKVSLKIL